ncbi:MAG: hypothetical protein ACRDNF_13300 [Streptosporangiaceae bacterium]
MTGLRGQVRDYLALRRAMGFKMEKHGPLLDSLAIHLEAAGLGTVTVQAAVEWAMLPQDVHPHRWRQRLDIARGFARANAVSPPRIHDLRHLFAVRTLAGWYRDGGDVAARMPLLSAYLGHVSPVSTYWYLH